MKVDKELIEKYHLNLCNQKEKEVVEAWLLSGEWEEDCLLERSEQGILQKEIWQSLTRDISELSELKEQKTFFKRVFLNEKILPYLTAACLAIIISTTVLFNKYSKTLPAEVIVESTENDRKETSVASLEVSLLPHSKVELVKSGKSARIEFSGSVTVANNSDYDIDMEVYGGGSDRTGKKVHFKKGHQYLLFEHQYKGKEIFIVDNQRLYDLPLPLSNKVEKLLNI